MRWNAAVFAALALHVGGLTVWLERDQILERAQELLTDIKDDKDKVIDFLDPINVNLVVKSLERGTESEQKIDNLENFYIVADKLKNNFTPEQVAAAQQNMDAEIATAKQMKAAGADQRKVVDYILSQQGKYDETQNSLIAMMDVPLAEREGSCKAWFLDMSAVLAAVYPEDYAAGRIKAETFDGADLDGDGKLDTVPHVRTVIAQPDGETLIAEGKKSYIDNPDPKAPKPTTEEVSTIVTRSFLASNDLYTHPEGPTLGKHIDTQYKSFLDMPGSPATYAGGLVLSQSVPAEKPTEKVSVKPKPPEAPLFAERPEEFKVTVLEEPIVVKKITLADLQDPNFDLSQFNDIDPDLIQYTMDHWQEPRALQVLRLMQGQVRGNNYQFTSLAHLSDTTMAKQALRLGMTLGEGGLERPWAVIYSGDVQTVEAATELIKFAGISPHYFTLTKEPALAVAQELGKAHPAVLELDFVPSQAVLTALDPIERIMIHASISNVAQIEPLVNWLSDDIDQHELYIYGSVPEDLEKSVQQRFGYHANFIH